MAVICTFSYLLIRLKIIYKAYAVWHNYKYEANIDSVRSKGKYLSIYWSSC